MNLQRYMMITKSENDSILFACEFFEENDEKASEFMDSIVTNVLYPKFGSEINTNLYEEKWINGI